MDRRLYNLANARAFLQAASLCLRYAAVYIRRTDDGIYERLRDVRERVEELLQRVEAELSRYIDTPREVESSLHARRILLEVLSSR